MIRIIAFIFVLLSFNSAFGVDLQKDIIEARQELGKFLNENTKVLKTSFQDVENSLTSANEDLKSLKSIAEDFRVRTSNPEVNPTVLKQGKMSVPACNYDVEDLVWKDDKWACKNVKYLTECENTSDESKQESGDDIVCVLKGKFKFVDAGWGLCNPDTGIQKSKYKCMYIDSNGTPLYQVADSVCGTKPAEVSSNCWGTWIAEDWESCTINSIKNCTAKICYLPQGTDCQQSTGGGCSGTSNPKRVSDYEISRLHKYTRRIVSCSYQSYSCATASSFIQTRDVKCSKKYCNNSIKPASTKTCPPNYGVWKVGSFSYSTTGRGNASGGCSSSVSYYKRSVRCSTSLCNPKTIPLFYKGVEHESCSGH